MTRSEETARVAALRAAFAASEEPDPWRWFARVGRNMTQAIKDDARVALARSPNAASQQYQETLRMLLNSDTSPCLYRHEAEAIVAAIAALDALSAANPQSAAEPPRDRTDFDWDVIGETESF